MIDFEKELKKFDFFRIDNELIEKKELLSTTYENLNNSVAKFNKEQNNIRAQLDEITSILDENTEKTEENRELKRTLENSKEEKLKIVKSLLPIFDQFEDFYRFFFKGENGEWNKQVKLLWDNIGQLMLKTGLSRMECDNTFFDAQLSVVSGTAWDENHLEGVVLEVIKSGYLYDAVVLRKANVIVNKKGD